MSEQNQNSAEVIFSFFSHLTENQTSQFRRLQEIYTEWNAKINVISRKDMENFYTHHVLHSLSVAKIYSIPAGSTLIDVGTGGGFPGIPLAILFPEVKFTLLDSIGKKIKVVEEVANALELRNVIATQGRSEDVREKFDVVTGRAVKAIPEFYGFTKHLLKPGGRILYLKGGDFAHEIAPFGNRIQITGIYELFPFEFFETKKVVQIITK